VGEAEAGASVRPFFRSPLNLKPEPRNLKPET